METLQLKTNGARPVRKRLKGDKWPQTMLMMYYSQSAVFTHADTDVTQTDALSPCLPDAGHGASSQRLAGSAHEQSVSDTSSMASNAL